MKRILIVAESIDANQGSGAKANLALIQNLAQAGFKCKVFHYSRKQIELENLRTILIPENRYSLLFFLSRIERYLRSYLKLSLNPKIEKKTGFSFTLKNDRNSIIAALKKEKNFSPDWILSLSQGGSFRPHHALLRMPELHDKWIAYIHDPYPMHWYPKPYTWKEPGHELKQQFMKSIADCCTYTAFPSELLMELMGKHYRPFREKGIVIPHQIADEVRERKPDFLKIDPTEFILLHAGNLLQARKPKGLVEGFRSFLLNNPSAKAKLILIGPAPHYEEYLKGISKEEPRIISICENKSFEEVTWLQNRASVNIILEAKATSSPFLPGKFPHCIRTRKPILVLGPVVSEVRRILGPDYPYWSSIDDMKRISNHVEILYKKWESGSLEMDYEDQFEYLSSSHLKKMIENLRKP
ncbi:UDP-glycosyltransferase [Gramella sp. GC03-9]|uniref:UDP-glycosyltransferase n=1 Tax=Christiangramia oceanisediminis TaxID=2920386 RepID=A0A9X2HZU0_9FLAO|nr:UDP-glycosyltransferase [Gramella oceanisediminis]MCP9198311.1 UDP-glycosyltransferase [Gramella oceanisediminis]